MHHAYLYRSDTRFDLESWPQLVPDKISVARRRYDVIGIDEVRSIIREVMLTPLEGSGHRVLVLETAGLTHEAAQAMLKVFEEPRSGITLVLALPAGYELVPTLRSRFFELVVPDKISLNPDFQDFLGLSVADRLATITSRLNAEDALWLSNLKQGLVAWLKLNPPIVGLPTYEFIVSRLGTRGSSHKMLLELLALTLSSDKK